jgi:hypothetical protein
MGASHPKPFLPERQTSTMDSTSFERLLESGLPRDDMAPSHAGKAHGSSPHADSATSHTLESELDLLANSLKRKRSDSRDDPNGQKRNPPPPQLSEGRKRVDSVTEETSPATGGARERIVPIVGSSAEHPIELDDGTPEAAASDSSDPTARRETIVIDDDDWLDVEDVPSSIPAVRYAAKKLRRAEQRGAAPARVPLLPRKRRTTPAVQSQRGTIPVGPRQSKNYPELRIDDPEFLRAREHVEKVIEYTFERSELLLEALYPDRSKPVMIAGQLISYANYRLALLGDSVLKTALIDSRMQEGESLSTFPPTTH